MLRHKRIRYRRIDLVAVLHRVLVRGLGVPGGTVPALRIEGTRVQGDARHRHGLGRAAPQAAVVSRRSERRRAVVEAEAWGVLQPVPRRIIWAGLKRDRSTIGTYLEGAHTPIPVGVAERVAAPIVAAAEGVIGAAEHNAADFQIATSTALLASMDDVRPLTGRAARPGGCAPRRARLSRPAAAGLFPRLAARLSKIAPVPSGRARTVRPDIHGSRNPTPAAPRPNDR